MRIDFEIKAKGAAVCAVMLFLGSVFAASAALAETYTYDALGRIASITSDAGVVTYYCYDTAGNRTYVGPHSTCS